MVIDIYRIKWRLRSVSQFIATPCSRPQKPWMSRGIETFHGLILPDGYTPLHSSMIVRLHVVNVVAFIVIIIAIHLVWAVAIWAIFFWNKRSGQWTIMINHDSTTLYNIQSCIDGQFWLYFPFLTIIKHTFVFNSQPKQPIFRAALFTNCCRGTGSFGLSARALSARALSARQEPLSSLAGLGGSTAAVHQGLMWIMVNDAE